MATLINILDEIWRFYEGDKQGVIDFFASGYKHFNKKAKRKEAKEMERDLKYKREAVEEIKKILRAEP